MAEELDIREIIQKHRVPFESRAMYNEVGDCVEIFFEDADGFDERIDCWLTVYRAFDDKRLVGFKLKNIRALLSKFDALRLDYEVSGKEGHIRLAALVSFFPWIKPSSARMHPYQDVLSHTGHKRSESFVLTPA